MINEAYLDVRKQRKVLDSILSELSSDFPDKADTFSKEKYRIVFSDNYFDGKYNFMEDRIEIDKLFIYDAMCSGDLDSIRNTVIHEAAHRQVALNDKRDSFADHWIGWLEEYLPMGGMPPEVYIKRKINEASREYWEISEQDIGYVTIITDNGTRTAKELIRKRSEINSPFLVIDVYGTVNKRNFRS